MDISGIGSSFLNNLTDMKVIEERADEAEFETILKNAMDKDDDEQLKDACGDYEAYFLNKLFSQMRQAIPKSELMEASQGRDVYEDMLYDAYSKEIASGKGTGIKEMLYNQLKK